ncbi:MAG TPA: glycosyl hydrolase family 18 protein [Thermoanaerobaculia bacterium]|nr:glycosyl hydrolase family 18 protein [Thermoanaerobaculia bacterium]
MLRKALLFLLSTALLLLVPSAPAPSRSFDTGRNGIWIGHQWYTGRHVKTGKPVPVEERRALIRRLRENGFRHVYLHAGPLLADGSIRDRPGPELRALLREAPELVVLAWIGGGTHRLDLTSERFRRATIATAIHLRDEGFHGIHLDIEPLRDAHPGYLELLRDLRSTLGRDFILSHATRRAGPFGLSPGLMKRWFWSEKFYRDAMALTDETVLMAYDTTLDTGLLYTQFVRHETRLLLRWGCEVPGHRILIGIPSFEDSAVSNPKVENIPNAIRGVRAALADHGGAPACFEGIALYAEWVTSPEEWRQFNRSWH